MFRNMKVSTKVFLVTSMLCLVNIAVCVYQFCNFVISPWNIIPTVLIVLIIFGNIKNMVSPKVKSGDAPASSFGVPPSDNTRRNISRENEDFFAINTSFPTKLTVKSILFKVLFLAIFIGLAFLFNMWGNNIKYDTVVTGTIISKSVEGDIYTDVSSDGVSTSDERYLVMVVSYEVDGTIYRTEVVDKFSTSRDGNTIELCVNRDGEFVAVYDKLISYDLMFYASIVLAVLTVISLFLKLPNQYLVMLVLIFIGFGAICLMNSANWASWLLKDFTVFGGCFLTLGVMCCLQLIMLRLVYMVNKRKDPSYVLE